MSKDEILFYEAYNYSDSHFCLLPTNYILVPRQPQQTTQGFSHNRRTMNFVEQTEMKLDVTSIPRLAIELSLLIEGH